MLLEFLKGEGYTYVFRPKRSRVRLFAVKGQPICKCPIDFEDDAEVGEFKMTTEKEKEEIKVFPCGCWTAL